MFLKEVCIYLIKNTGKINIMTSELKKTIDIYFTVICSCDGKAEFPVVLLQSSVLLYKSF